VTLASLKEDSEYELIVRTLAAGTTVRVWGWLNESIARHVPSGTRVLLDAPVVPILLRDLSPEPQGQVATVLDWDAYNVRLLFSDGQQVWMPTERFIDAVFDGTARDAS